MMRWHRSDNPRPYLTPNTPSPSPRPPTPRRPRAPGVPDPITSHSSGAHQAPPLSLLPVPVLPHGLLGIVGFGLAAPWARAEALASEPHPGVPSKVLLGFSEPRSLTVRCGYSPSRLPTPTGLLQVTRSFDGYQGLDLQNWAETRLEPPPHLAAWRPWPALGFPTTSRAHELTQPFPEHTFLFTWLSRLTTEKFGREQVRSA